MKVKANIHLFVEELIALIEAGLVYNRNCKPTSYFLFMYIYNLSCPHTGQSIISFQGLPVFRSKMNVS